MCHFFVPCCFYKINEMFVMACHDQLYIIYIQWHWKSPQKNQQVLVFLRIYGKIYFDVWTPPLIIHPCFATPIHVEGIIGDFFGSGKMDKKRFSKVFCSPVVRQLLWTYTELTSALEHVTLCRFWTCTQCALPQSTPNISPYMLVIGIGCMILVPPPPHPTSPSIYQIKWPRITNFNKFIRSSIDIPTVRLLSKFLPQFLQWGHLN